MPIVADDAIPITKVLSHVLVSVKHYRGLLKSDQEWHFLVKNSNFLSEDWSPKTTLREIINSVNNQSVKVPD